MSTEQDTTIRQIEGARLQYDDNGQPIIEIAECGHCGARWNDAAISHLTPTPSGRCPFEYEHEYDDGPATFTLTITLGNDAMQTADDIADALRDTAEKLRGDGMIAEGSIRDLNGNSVGHYVSS